MFCLCPCLLRLLPQVADYTRKQLLPKTPYSMNELQQRCGDVLEGGGGFSAQALLDAAGCTDSFDRRAILCSIAPQMLVPEDMVRAGVRLVCGVDEMSRAAGLCVAVQTFACSCRSGGWQQSACTNKQTPLHSPS